MCGQLLLTYEHESTFKLGNKAARYGEEIITIILADIVIFLNQKIASVIWLLLLAILRIIKHVS